MKKMIRSDSVMNMIYLDSQKEFIRKARFAQLFACTLIACPLLVKGANSDQIADLEILLRTARVASTSETEQAFSDFASKYHFTCEKTDAEGRICRASVSSRGGKAPIGTYSYEVSSGSTHDLGFKSIHLDLTFDPSSAPSLADLSNHYFRQWRDYRFLVMDYPRHPTECSIFLIHENKKYVSKTAIQLTPTKSEIDCKDRAVKLSATILKGK